jgi:hypothetical protein
MRITLLPLAVFCSAAGFLLPAAGQTQATDRLPDDTQFGRAGGQNVQPFYEGWQKFSDGHISMWFGYLNRNFEEQVDVAVGPDNHFDLKPDMGQPTHFYPRRGLFVFRVDLPKDWPAEKHLVWTVTAHGKASQASGWLQPEWEVDDGVIQMNIGPGGAPPDPPNSPPARMVNADTTAVAGKALKLSASLKDDGIPKPRRRSVAPAAQAPSSPLPLPPGATLKPRATLGLRVRWILYRGPDSGGEVSFDEDASRAAVGATEAQAATAATFSNPGVYWLRAIATDGLLETPYDFKVTVIR